MSQPKPVRESESPSESIAPSPHASSIYLTVSENRTFRFLVIWVLPVLLVLAFAIRVLLAQQPLWIDELHTAWVVEGNWSDVAERAQLGNQSPLFFYAVKALVQLMGFSTLTLRTIPLIASVLQLAVVFWVLNRWTGASAAGFVAAFLLLINPLQLFVGTDARPYAVIGLIACLQVGALVHHWQESAYQNRRDWGFDITWILSNVLLFYLHYTTIFWIASIWLALCWLSVTMRPRPGFDQLIRWLAIEPFVIAMACLPGIYHTSTLWSVREQWSSFIRIEAFWLNMQSVVFVLLIGPLIAVAVLQLLYLLKPSQGWATTRNQGWVPLLTITLSGLIVPPAIAAVLTGWNIVPVAFHRYIIASVTAGFFLPGLIVGIWRWPRVRWMVTALIVSIGLGVNLELLQTFWTGQLPVLHTENWERVVETIRRQNVGREYPVVLCPGLVEDRRLVPELLPSEVEERRKFQRYCIFALDGPYRVFDDPAKNFEKVFARPTDATTPLAIPKVDLIQQSRGCFLVVRGHQQDVARKIADYVRRLMAEGQRYPVVVEEIYSVPVSLYRMEYRDPEIVPPARSRYRTYPGFPGWDAPPMPSREPISQRRP